MKTIHVIKLPTWKYCMIMIEAFSNCKDGRKKKKCNPLEVCQTCQQLVIQSHLGVLAGQPTWAGLGTALFGPYIRVRPWSKICACLIFGLGLDWVLELSGPGLSCVSKSRSGLDVCKLAYPTHGTPLMSFVEHPFVGKKKGERAITHIIFCYFLMSTI